MPRPEKLSIGVLFGRPNFLLAESIGKVSEDLIQNMNGKTLDTELFSEFSVQPGNSLDLRSSDKTRILHVDAGNILYTQDHYNQAHTIEWKEINTEFVKIWNLINRSVKLHEIRRIGIVAEYRIAADNNDASNILLEKMTKLNSTGHKKKFILTYETSYPTKNTENFSPLKDEFINVIEHYYDSTQDSHHGEEGFINQMLDVQHYYEPVVSPAKCIDEVTKLYGIFINHENELKSESKKLGLING